MQKFLRQILFFTAFFLQLSVSFSSQNVAQELELAEAWKSCIKHSNLRTNPSFLETVDDLVKNSNKGIDHAKIESALNGNFGDVIANASGDDLVKMMERMNMPHFDGQHLDDIIERLDNYTDLRTDLLNNPHWFETFDDILKEPANYWDIIKNADIPKNAALSQWGNAKWFKEITTAGKQFEADILLSLKNKTGKAYNDLKSFVNSMMSKNLEDYTLLSQVRLKTKNGYMIADQVYVRKIYDAELDEYPTQFKKHINLKTSLQLDDVLDLTPSKIDEILDAIIKVE